MSLARFFRGRWKSKQVDKAEESGLDKLSMEDQQDEQYTRLEGQSIVLVMGVTGSGKSYFINQLEPNSVAEGHGLRSGESTPGIPIHTG